MPFVLQPSLKKQQSLSYYGSYCVKIHILMNILTELYMPYVSEWDLLLSKIYFIFFKVMILGFRLPL